MRNNEKKIKFRDWDQRRMNWTHPKAVKMIHTSDCTNEMKTRKPKKNREDESLGAEDEKEMFFHSIFRNIGPQQHSAAIRLHIERIS